MAVGMWDGAAGADQEVVVFECAVCGIVVSWMRVSYVDDFTFLLEIETCFSQAEILKDGALMWLISKGQLSQWPSSIPSEFCQSHRLDILAACCGVL